MMKSMSLLLIFLFPICIQASRLNSTTPFFAMKYQQQQYNKLGFEVGYSSFALLSYRLKAKAAYLTNRIRNSNNTFAPKMDDLRLSLGWHLRPLKPVDPYIQLVGGYSYFDDEGFGLDNHDLLYGLGLGVNFNVVRERLGLFADYSIHTGAPLIDMSTLNFGVWFHLLPWML